MAYDPRFPPRHPPVSNQTYPGRLPPMMPMAPSVPVTPYEEPIGSDPGLVAMLRDQERRAKERDPAEFERVRGPVVDKAVAEHQAYNLAKEEGRGEDYYSPEGQIRLAAERERGQQLDRQIASKQASIQDALAGRTSDIDKPMAGTSHHPRYWKGDDSADKADRDAAGAATIGKIKDAEEAEKEGREEGYEAGITEGLKETEGEYERKVELYSQMTPSQMEENFGGPRALVPARYWMNPKTGKREMTEAHKEYDPRKLEAIPVKDKQGRPRYKMVKVGRKPVSAHAGKGAPDEIGDPKTPGQKLDLSYALDGIPGVANVIDAAVPGGIDVASGVVEKILDEPSSLLPGPLREIPGLKVLDSASSPEVVAELINEKFPGGTDGLKRVVQQAVKDPSTSIESLPWWMKMFIPGSVKEDLGRASEMLQKIDELKSPGEEAADSGDGELTLAQRGDVTPSEQVIRDTPGPLEEISETIDPSGLGAGVSNYFWDIFDPIGASAREPHPVWESPFPYPPARRGGVEGVTGERGELGAPGGSSSGEGELTSAQRGEPSPSERIIQNYAAPFVPGGRVDFGDPDVPQREGGLPNWMRRSGVGPSAREVRGKEPLPRERFRRGEGMVAPGDRSKGVPFSVTSQPVVGGQPGEAELRQAIRASEEVPTPDDQLGPVRVPGKDWGEMLDLYRGGDTVAGSILRGEGIDPDLELLRRPEPPGDLIVRDLMSRADRFSGVGEAAYGGEGAADDEDWTAGVVDKVRQQMGDAPGPVDIGGGESALPDPGTGSINVRPSAIDPEEIQRRVAEEEMSGLLRGAAAGAVAGGMPGVPPEAEGLAAPEAEGLAAPEGPRVFGDPRSTFERPGPTDEQLGLRAKEKQRLESRGAYADMIRHGRRMAKEQARNAPRFWYTRTGDPKADAAIAAQMAQQMGGVLQEQIKGRTAREQMMAQQGQYDKALRFKSDAELVKLLNDPNLPYAMRQAILRKIAGAAGIGGAGGGGAGGDRMGAGDAARELQERDPPLFARLEEMAGEYGDDRGMRDFFGSIFEGISTLGGGDFHPGNKDQLRITRNKLSGLIQSGAINKSNIKAVSSYLSSSYDPEVWEYLQHVDADTRRFFENVLAGRMP